MPRRFRAMAAMIAMLVAAPAVAGTISHVEGRRYDGAVVSVQNDTVEFVWQMPADESGSANTDDTDIGPRARGTQTIPVSFAMRELSSINGVSPAVFQTMYSANLFYRVAQVLDYGRVQALASSNLVRQIVGIVVLGLVLCVLMPALMMLVARLLPGPPMGFFGGVGYSVLLFCVGIALSTGVSLLTSGVPFMVGTVQQYVLSGLLVCVVALSIHAATSHTFWQGLGFIAVWAAAMAGGARIALAIVSSGIV